MADRGLAASGDELATATPPGGSGAAAPALTDQVQEVAGQVQDQAGRLIDQARGQITT